MAIEVLIKQKLFGSKTMPLEVILGEHLHYGNFVKDQLFVGELGETEFIAYNPDHIGRGFSVVWNPKEKKKIALRLPQPSTTQELNDFYAAIERMTKHWGGKLIIDGSPVRLTNLQTSLREAVDYNSKIVKQFSQQVLDGAHETLVIYSTMWPLTIGKEEASYFLEDSDHFAEWLHEKQSMDVYFASPNFYTSTDGIIARYILTNALPAIFPLQPNVPFGAADPATGKQLKCQKWFIWLGIDGEKEPLCEMEYARFLELLPENKKSKYDGNHFLLAEMTEEEIRALSCQ